MAVGRGPRDPPWPWAATLGKGLANGGADRYSSDMGRIHGGAQRSLLGAVRKIPRLWVFILFHFVMVSLSLFGQTSSPPSGTEQNSGNPSKGPVFLSDPSVLVGATLDGIFSRFGVPQSVHTVRGLEAWQDDVVFSYPDWDLYWFKDRVWQVGLTTAYGLKKGDTLDTIISTLGKPVQQTDNTLVYSLPSRAWPLRMRILLDNTGALQTLYIFRSDF